MKPVKHFLPAAGAFTVLQLAIMQAYAAPVNLSNIPLFLTSASKANVMMMYGNSNSMDTDPTGRAVGSASDESKSEIARVAIKSVAANYSGLINMGLMAYQQNAMTQQYIYDSQYDVSFNPADWKADFNGARNSQTKKFRVKNPSKTSEYMYYNVNLPFYDEGVSGAKFCVSTTACTSPTNDFKGVAPGCTTAEHPTNGPFDGYKCYTTKSGPGNGPNGGYGGNVNNANFRPTDSDLGQGITDFGKQLTYYYVDKTWFVNTSPGKGYVHVPVRDLDAGQAEAIGKKLAKSQFTTNAPTNPAQPLQNAGLSPLAGTVATANKYFAGTLTETNQGGPQVKPPESCSKNFLITLTDGLPSVTADGTPSANVDANLTELLNQVKGLKDSASKTETYVVGFALPYGVKIDQLHSIAVAGGSEKAYDAKDTASLNAAFAEIFSDIVSKTAASASVALSSGSVAKDAYVFQARFASSDWSGQLLSYKLTNGALSAAPVWDAGKVLNTIGANDRVILTTKPSLTTTTRKGIPFRWPAVAATPSTKELDVAQTAALSIGPNGAVDLNGAARLNYLRGAADNEGDVGLKFRKRVNSKLGDIVNSSPFYVAAPDSNYAGETYRAYREAKKARAPMLYVGANDGMLHGFDAVTGREKLAFVPSTIYPNLSKLADPKYVHRYFVDGSPYASDVQYADKTWHTVLVSGLGAGGRGVVGLDVTNPEAFSENVAANIVNFEFTEKNDPDVGYVTGGVNIVKLDTGEYAAVFANGYNATGTDATTGGKSALFIVNIETGALIRKIVTKAGDTTTPNAMATPMLVDLDGDRAVDVAYAGDLLGNMWKINLDGKTPSQWGVEYKLFNAGKPITTAPDVGEHPLGGFMVYFGTGKYIELTDVATKPGNAIYGIWDRPLTPATDGTLLNTIKDGTTPVVQASALLTQSYAPVKDSVYRTGSSNAVDWTKHRGWTAAFPDTGERLVSDPILRDGRLIFTSIIPSDAACSPGGTSYLNQIDWLNGGRLAESQFDTNGDGKFDGRDTSAVSLKLDGIASGPAIQNVLTGDPGAGFTGAREVSLINDSAGNVRPPPQKGKEKNSRRLSWRQVK